MQLLYKIFVYLGLMSVAGSFIVGFRYDPTAPADNYIFNIAIYAAYILLHLLMTMPIFKRVVFKNPQSTLPERRIFVTVSIVTWLMVFFLHKPVSGFYLDLPLWANLLGASIFMFGVFVFFEFANFQLINGLMGTHGSEMSHSVGAETPLATEGTYGLVRHPMYLGATIYCLGSVLVHPHAGQLLFAILVAGSFVAFIPFEEKQLIEARGKEYMDYKVKVPYRLIPKVW